MSKRSKVIPCRDFRWQEVALQGYRAEEAVFKDVTRQVLLGDAEEESDLQFITRYFEIQPGGYSSLERHRHPHSVVVLRGTGTVILDDEVREIGPLDCVYVAPDSLHQFHATGQEALGFLCIVDRVRDAARPASAEERAAAQARIEHPER